MKNVSKLIQKYLNKIYHLDEKTEELPDATLDKIPKSWVICRIDYPSLDMCDVQDALKAYDKCKSYAFVPYCGYDAVIFFCVEWDTLKTHFDLFLKDAKSKKVLEASRKEKEFQPGEELDVICPVCEQMRLKTPKCPKCRGAGVIKVKFLKQIDN